MIYLMKITEAWLTLFSVHMLEVSLFILLIWSINKLFRMTTHLRYLLWLLALIKLFIPPIISLPFSIQTAMPGQVFLLQMITPAQIVDHHTSQISLSLLVFGVWALWVCVLTVFILFKNIQFRQCLHDAKPVANSSKSKLSLQTPRLPTFVSPKIQVPLLLGIWNPKLYLPQDWHNWKAKQLNSIIAHETAHFHKRDVLVLVLQYLAIVLFGLNPLVWLVHKRLEHVRELHCDEVAIQRAGIHPIDYSKLIYSFIEKQARPSTPLLMGKSFFENNRSIFRRINHVLNLREANMKTKTIYSFVLVLFLGLLILPFSWKCGDQSSQPLSENDSELAKVQSSGTFFQEYDQPPMPIGGFKAIQQNLHYPEIARKAGIEGRVIAQILISEEGKVIDTRIFKSLGKNGCDEAAINALKSVKWQPALNDGKPVKVWVAMPVVFKLK